MLFKFGSTRNDILVKREIQQIFVKECTKNLMSSPQGKHFEGIEWANDSRLVTNYGPVYFLNKFLSIK